MTGEGAHISMEMASLKSLGHPPWDLKITVCRACIPLFSTSVGALKLLSSQRQHQNSFLFLKSTLPYCSILQVCLTHNPLSYI